MNNKPTVVVPSDPKKIDELIFALEYQIQNDVNEKDREIHKAALEKLKAASRKSPPKRWAFFISVSRDERQVHLYTVPVCAQNPEGALRSISDTVRRCADFAVPIRSLNRRSG